MEPTTGVPAAQPVGPIFKLTLAALVIALVTLGIWGWLNSIDLPSTSSPADQANAATGTSSHVSTGRDTTAAQPAPRARPTGTAALWVTMWREACDHVTTTARTSLVWQGQDPDGFVPEPFCDPYSTKFYAKNVPTDLR